jgi:hypothetical protein
MAVEFAISTIVTYVILCVEFGHFAQQSGNQSPQLGRCQNVEGFLKAHG